MEMSKYENNQIKTEDKEILDTKGEANTTEILEHVNSTMRHGTTPQQLGNVLSKDKDIMKIATTKRGGALFRPVMKYVCGSYALALKKITNENC